MSKSENRTISFNEFMHEIFKKDAKAHPMPAEASIRIRENLQKILASKTASEVSKK
jgi:hypothetical protein